MLHFASLLLTFSVSEPAPFPTPDSLRELAPVASVAVAPAKRPVRRRVIHILNWHFVPKNQFAADLNGQRDVPLTEDEMDEAFEEFRDDVESVQTEQLQVLRVLIRKHGLKQVHVEGLAVEAVPKFQKLLRTLKTTRKGVFSGNSPLDLFIQDEFKKDLLAVGAAGQLVMSGELKKVLPTETKKSLKDASPFDAEGKVRLDEAQIERRENVIVKHLMKGGPLVVVILGGGHDLSNNLPEDCEYIRVAMKEYRRASSQEE